MAARLSGGWRRRVLAGPRRQFWQHQNRPKWCRFIPALTDGFHNRDLRVLVADLLGVTISEYTGNQMTYDLRRLRLKGLIFRPPRTNRYFVTPYGWKVARLFSRLEARVFRPAVAIFTTNDAVLPFPLRASLDRVDAQLDELIYQAFPQIKAA
jgi:hypothetical protein